MNKTFSNGIVIGAVCATVLELGLVTVTMNSGVLGLKDISKVNSIARAVKGNYYLDISDEEILNGVLKGIFLNTDDYSTYYTPDEADKLLTTMNGETLCGIGISYSRTRYTGDYAAIYVHPGSPAEKAGIRPQDIILSVDGTPIIDLELEEVSDLVRGEMGTSIELELLRGFDVFTVTVVRDVVDIKNAVSKRVSKDTGYIHITNFGSGLADLMKNYLEDFKDCKNIIIDVTANPGGDIESLKATLDLLIPQCKICTLDTAAGNQEIIEVPNGTELKYNFVILADDTSASCAELLVGVFKDYRYGTIIGGTTFGKGVWQTFIPFPGGDAIKITFGEYLLPNGESIHEKGVSPDIESETPYETALEYLGEEV